MTNPGRVIRVAHSPDSDDAFMFYALAEGKIDTGEITYVHELQDIETLNRRALRGELEVTAVSIHAYAYLADRYALLPHGSSMGDGYGPRLVARQPRSRESLAGARIAIPGTLTTAYLALRLWQPDFVPVPTPFDEIEEVVEQGERRCRPPDPRRSAHVPGPWSAPASRHGRVVVSGNGASSPAGRQRHSKGLRGTTY